MKRWLTFSFAVLLGTLPLGAQKAKDPQAHRVVLENEHVRVIEARASQGARSAMHSLVFDGRAKLQGADPKRGV